MILKNHAIALIRKERLSARSKTRRKASRNEFMEKGGMKDRVKSFREIDGGKDRSRAQHGFGKPIQNRLK